MPNTLSALPSSTFKLSNDPTQSIAGDVQSDIGTNPYGEMTEEILFGLINTLLEDIDSATGLDLLDMVQPLEDLFGGGGGLLSKFVAFVGSINPAGIISGIEGELSTIKTDVINFFTLGHGSVPVSSLTNAQLNLSEAPTFVAGSIGNPADWTVDMSNSRTDDGSGAAKLVCDGHFHALRSGTTPDDVMPVTPGQPVTETIYCSHTGLTITPGITIAPVQLQLALYTATGFSRFYTLDSYLPMAADVAWPGHTLTGTYTVESDVVGVQRRVLVTPDALDGPLWVDDENTVKGNTIQKSWVEGLEGDLEAGFSQWQTLVDVLASEASGIPIAGAEIADVIHAINHFNPFNILGSLGNSSLGDDLKNIINHTVAGAKGQPVSTTDASLADLYNAMNQAINNVDAHDVLKFVDTTTVIPVDPSWCNYIDVVGVGKGQDGENGELLVLFGQGGNCGKINATTWAKGTHYDGTLTGVTVTFNSDGSVTFSIPGHTMTAVMDPVTESVHLGSGWPGVGHSDPFVYNDKSYALGGKQNSVGGKGLGPGGGGAGGNGLTSGGPGGPAGGWVRARADAASVPTSGADTSAPSLPTPHVLSSTDTTITLSGSGSVDA